ncbi:class I SAM-dependent DNA methyltransferase [Marinicauda sp. Alg238-R41]|uniref:class I SAM-dependent DNA methyltransferase n=1 Tax=Marinicauda sp. Alg238-R41 TaxID=2993447 RepID=UPI0022E05CF7|nr:methyltransferase [Marinicauda sp. Alg238-R41]
MAAKPFFSADPAADRRAAFADALAADGDLPGAIEVLTGALERVPGWAAGWYRLGEYCERAGQRDAATQAFARAVDADPADALGAGMKRDLLSAAPVCESMPAAFVELLFDQYAPRFETSLVGQLGYRGPELLFAQLASAGFTRAQRALDLGCGTGLMGEVLRPHCGTLIGMDISQAMLDQARAKHVYDRLEKTDIAALEIAPDRYDLIVAADVFAYLGALERIIAWCVASLVPGGRLAFTVEAGEAPVALRESRRFAHSPEYIADLLGQAGFAGVDMTPCVLRRDRGADIASLCVCASLPALTPDREDDGEAQVCA